MEGVWHVAEVGTENISFNFHFLVEWKVVTLGVDAAHDPLLQDGLPVSLDVSPLFWHLKRSFTFYRGSNICLNPIHIEDTRTTCEWEEGEMRLTKGCKQHCNCLLCDLLCTAVWCCSRLLRPSEDENITHLSQPVRTTGVVTWIQMPAPHSYASSSVRQWVPFCPYSCQAVLYAPSAGHEVVFMTSRSLVKCNNQSLCHLCVQ